MPRLANTTLVTFADGRQGALAQRGIMPAQRRSFTTVRLSQEADWRCHLAITWMAPKAGDPAERRAVITNTRTLPPPTNETRRVPTRLERTMAVPSASPLSTGVPGDRDAVSSATRVSTNRLSSCFVAGGPDHPAGAPRTAESM